MKLRTIALLALAAYAVKKKSGGSSFLTDIFGVTKNPLHDSNYDDPYRTYK